MRQVKKCSLCKNPVWEFTKTIIPFALVGLYEVIITNSRYALVGYFITSYPTRAHGIIVIYLNLISHYNFWHLLFWEDAEKTRSLEVQSSLHISNLLCYIQLKPKYLNASIPMSSMCLQLSWLNSLRIRKFGTERTWIIHLVSKMTILKANEWHS